MEKARGAQHNHCHIVGSIIIVFIAGAPQHMDNPKVGK